MIEELDVLARRYGVTRNKGIVVPCSGCGIGCYPVEPLDCFCMRCHAQARDEYEAGQAPGKAGGESP